MEQTGIGDVGFRGRLKCEREGKKPVELTRKGGVVKRRKYEREGKKGMINIVVKSGWNRIVE